MNTLLFFAASALAAPGADEPVPFGRDILPLFSANCFACHGPDAKDRQANLRLDIEAEAKKKGENGAAIVAGKPDQSLLFERIKSTDSALIMPPVDSHKKLKPEQIETIRRWIAEGAKWQRHWSFEAVKRPSGTLDDQVRARLAKLNLKLRPAASPHVLARRLALDLTGLPPTLEQADAFARNATPEAYEKLVDQLLASPRFGEHWARMWLDLARYADTKGYEKDLSRTMWPYRDWVIDAFNRDMPLDQFTTEQLAGDLLPKASQQQIIATAFHRNTMTNDEGGTDDEEFRVVAIKDRVDTTMQAWMGLTFGCAKCHTHKYDPVSIEDYYRLYAIFNQTEDADRYDEQPKLEILTPEQQEKRKRFQAEIAKLEAERARIEETDSVGPTSPWQAAKVQELQSLEGAKLAKGPNDTVLASGKSPEKETYTLTLNLAPGKHTALRLEALTAKLPRGAFAVGRNQGDPNFVISEITVELMGASTPTAIKLQNPRADYSQGGWPVSAAIDGDTKTGWAVAPRFHERHEAIFDFATPIEVASPNQLRVKLVQNYGTSLTLARFRIATSQADPRTLALGTTSPEGQKVRAELETARKNLKEAIPGTIPDLPILRELPAEKRRTTRVQLRGNFLDPGAKVEPVIPTAFGAVGPDMKATRLGVAQWLVAKDNPLTPRVWANRIWARLFGMGLVETEEDFGALGSFPSNPELLDWLAAEYRDQGWSLKKLLRTIVLSETYKQSSETTAKLLQADPRNAFASRGSRYRLGAEAVRDQALAVAGLLSNKMGGPSVMPPQPEGLWRSTYNAVSWVDAEGENRYRRGLYTYLKRTTPYPSFLTFDGGSGEVCQVRRIRTNTPLQALVLLNDPVYTEAAGALAKRMVADATDTKSRLARGLRLALIRPLREGEAAPLERLYQEASQSFAAKPKEAEALLRASRLKVAGPKNNQPTEKLSDAEWAAWVVTAGAILNLDELLTRN